MTKVDIISGFLGAGKTTLIKKLLDDMGLAYKDFGTNSEESCHYPIFGARAAKAVASLIASSESILRFMSMPAFFRPFIKRE